MHAASGEGSRNGSALLLQCICGGFLPNLEGIARTAIIIGLSALLSPAVSLDS